MKYTINIGGKAFKVEIDNLDARPVLARVDGETIEVWPEEENVQLPAAGHPKPLPASSGATLESSRFVRAPLPGTITAVFVRPGDQVAVGQALLVLEAMKMKNTLRASLAGEVANICVTPGQTVNHQDLLIELAV